MKQQLKNWKILLYLAVVCSGSLLLTCIRQQLQIDYMHPLLGTATLGFLFTALACVVIAGFEKIDARLEHQ